MPRRPRPRTTSAEHAENMRYIESLPYEPGEEDYSDTEYPEMFEEEPYEEYAEPLVEGRDFNQHFVPYESSSNRRILSRSQPPGLNQINEFSRHLLDNPDVNYLVALAEREAQQVSNRTQSRDNQLRGETGRRWLRKERGDPGDPNYFNNPNNRETLRPVDDNWAQDIARNRLGLTSDVYEEHDPLDLISDVFTEAPSYGSEGNIPSVRGSVGEPVGHRAVNEMLRAYDIRQGNRPHHLTSIQRPDAKGILKTGPGGKGFCEFSNSEYVMDIVSGQNTFVLTTFVANPGLYTSFPVLSQVASAFVYYRFTKLKIRFISTTSDTALQSGSNVAMGEVCMVVNENVAIQAPSNFVALANSPGAKTFKPSLNVSYEIDCTRAVVNQFFVRTNPTYQTTNQSATTITETWGLAGQPSYPGAPQLTDFLNFYIGSNACAVSSNLGEIHVDYTVQLMSPFLYGSINGAQNLYYRAQIGTESGITYADGLCYPLVSGYGNLMMQVDSAGGNVLRIAFPPSLNAGCYHIQMYSPGSIANNWGAADQTSWLVFPPNFAGCKLITPHCWNKSTVTDIQYHFSMSTGGYNTEAMPTFWAYDVLTSNTDWEVCICLSFYVQLTGTSATVVFPNLTGSYPGTFYQGSISVSQVHPNFQYSWSGGQGPLNV